MQPRIDREVQIQGSTRKHLWNSVLVIARFWLFLRVLTSAAAAALSTFNPATLLEKSIALWPPAQNVAAWLGRVFIAPWYRWDATIITDILVRGYIAWDGSTSYHPLFPLLSWPLYRLGLDPTLSLLVTASIAALGSFWLFHRLAILDLDPAKAWTALLLLGTYPAAYILFAPFTESLFLFLSILALYSMRRGRWAWVAVSCFLAALTRQQGLFLAVPAAWWAWEASGKSLHGIRSAWRPWLTILAGPAGLAAYTFYRIVILHEGTLNLTSPQGLIFSALLSPSANKIIPGQAMRWPWVALSLVINRAIHWPEVNVILNLTIGLSFVAAFILGWRYLKMADRLYCLTIILASFSLTTVDFAYIALPRHLMLAAPVFIGLAAALHKPWQRTLLISIQVVIMLFMLALFVLNRMIP